MTDARDRRSRFMYELQRWASVVLVVILLIVGWQLHDAQRTVNGMQDQVGSLKESVATLQSTANQTDASARELVEFVHEIEANSSSSESQQQVVDKIYQLLCATDDQVRIQACIMLGVTPQPGG